MARKYARSASKDVEGEMRRYKRGTARSGKSGKGGKVKSRKQAIAIGLSKARRKGKRVPPRPGSRKTSRSRSGGSRKRRSGS
jgi:hypothetical protein